MLPPWPGWDGLHPLVIHFPIALVLVAPLFLLLGMVVRRHAALFSVSALVLLVLGTAAAFVAVGTGEAAAEMVTRTDAINRVLERHSGMAETARNLLALLTVLYAATLAAPLFFKRLARPAYRVVGNGVFLALFGACGVLVANVAHQGGLLVHQFGVHAMMPASGAGASPLSGREPDREKGEREGADTR
jgi:uncharacterized membrane protein